MELLILSVILDNSPNAILLLLFTFTVVNVDSVYVTEAAAKVYIKN